MTMHNNDEANTYIFIFFTNINKYKQIIIEACILEQVHGDWFVSTDLIARFC